MGNYYSTPILSFRMKHVACGGWIEIRTDPKNTAYVVTEGARKQDRGEERAGTREGEIIIGGKTEEERERLANDAFAALEGKVEDRKRVQTDKGRIEELERERSRDWGDPGEANGKLRKAFRKDREVRKKGELATEDLKDRMSLGIELLEEKEEDRTRARFMEFGVKNRNKNNNEDEGAEKAKSKPLFATKETKPVARNPSKKLSRAEKATRDEQARKENFKRELSENTRAILDPFLNDVSSTTKLLSAPASASIKGIKRKRIKKALEPEPESNRDNNDNGDAEILAGDQNSSTINRTPLVEYDSD